MSELFSPIVTRLVAERPDSLGLGDDPLCEVIPRHSYHGPYSNVLEIELRTEHAKWRGFVKSGIDGHERLESSSCPEGPSQAEFDLLSKLWDAFQSSPHFGTPKPIAFYPEYSAIVTEDVGGRNFSMELRARANIFVRRAALDRLAVACRMFGQWLLKFQAVTARPPDALFDLDDMRAYIDRRLKRLVELRYFGVDSDWRRRVLVFFDRVAATIRENERSVVGVHGDFSLGNLLVSGERVAVIDFETFSYGSVMHDITHLYHHLYHLRSNPRYRAGVAKKLSKALLQGYDPQFDTDAPLFRFSGFFACSTPSAFYWCMPGPAPVR